jgi:hypothetical protein
MKKVAVIFEIGYLIVAIVFLVETYLNWSEDRSRAYLFLLFSALAMFMYFFRKRFRKKMQNNK